MFAEFILSDLYEALPLSANQQVLDYKNRSKKWIIVAKKEKQKAKTINITHNNRQLDKANISEKKTLKFDFFSPFSCGFFGEGVTTRHWMDLNDQK